MTNTPKTDAACGWPWGHHGRIESSDLLINVDGPFVHAAVARELERENAALREILINADELERYSGSDGRRQWGKCSTWLHTDDAVIIVSAKTFDAIRKEAQP